MENKLLKENDCLTVDEKVILFNTLRSAVRTMSKTSVNSGGTAWYETVKSAKYQTIEKVLCLLAEELKQDCTSPEVGTWTREQVFDGANVSNVDTIHSIISDYVAI